jgi:adenine-specific DNA-methyltransferase
MSHGISQASFGSPLLLEDRAILPAAFLEQVEFLRWDASRKMRSDKKVELGQFLTSMPVAQFMASMVLASTPAIHILDAGAGVGTLFAALVAELCQRPIRPQVVTVTAYEIDESLVEYLHYTMDLCRKECSKAGIQFVGKVIGGDFIENAVDLLTKPLFLTQPSQQYNCTILNPPYLKIRSDSRTRLLLRRVGAEVSNLYTGFLATAMQLLKPGGEMVAITPRSFCNGPYFKQFRQSFLRSMGLRRLHLFESRQQAFQDDAVLQENVILHAIKNDGDKSTNKNNHYEKSTVTITSSAGPDDDMICVRDVPHDQVVHAGDPQSFIHIVADDLGQDIADSMSAFRASLNDLGLSVSTGPVVDFRAQQFLRIEAEPGTVPLIYPTHFDRRYVTWPKPEGRKPNAIMVAEQTEPMLLPNEHYVLVKRFSSKEEKKRIVAAVYDANRIASDCVTFENHLNYFHQSGGGLSLTLAKGLAAFLNWSLVDAHFRQFNGHTQVNATDLRSMKYPTRAQLKALGAKVGASFPDQQELDGLVEKELLSMSGMQDGAGSGGGGSNGANRGNGDHNVTLIRQRIAEALEVLKALGLPRGQQNERSALTLLALLNLRPETSWSEASNPLLGITPMMEFFAAHYGKNYKPNTRETVRRQTVHQFLDAGLLVENPDKKRPPNSPDYVYQIDGTALELLRTFGTAEWEQNLRAYLASVETLVKHYAQEREMARIPIAISSGVTITLSPGGQNVLVEQIITEFAPRFTPGGKLLYVGDTDKKFAYFNVEGLAELGVRIDEHGKMPDVIIHHTEKNWLVLVEAVTSHGPVNPKRKGELEELFNNSRAGLVLVTAFLSRKVMVEYLNEISWETEVWVAEAPSHIIHFNGERFLGPY